MGVAPGRSAGQVGTEASHPAQEHGAAPGAPCAQLVLPAGSRLGGEPGPGSGRCRKAGGDAPGSGQEGGLESGEGLALRGFPLLSSSFSQQFSPASAMEPLGQQVLGKERHEGDEGPEGPHLWLVQGGGTCGKGHAPFASSVLQLMSGQTQEKLPPLTLLKLGNQVQPGGAGGRVGRVQGRRASQQAPGDWARP